MKKECARYMRSTAVSFCLLVALIAFSSSVLGATLTVPGDFATIHIAIANASDGDTILVSNGTYANFIVDKELEIISLESPHGPFPVTIVPINSSVSALIEIASDDVLIEGFRLSGSGIAGEGLHFAGIRINTDASDSDLERIEIIGNVVENIHRGPGGSGFTALGIQLFTDARKIPSYEIEDVLVRNNTIRNITSDLGGAYGIQTVDDMDDVLLEYNNITDVEGSWSIGIAVDSHDGNTTKTEVSVLSNVISDVDEAGDGLAFLVESNATADDVALAYNWFLSSAHGVLNKNVFETLVAEHNFWDSCDGPSDTIFNPGFANGTGLSVLGLVNFDPWLGVCFYNKTNDACSIETANSTVYASLNASDVEAVWVSYTVNGTNYNRSFEANESNVFSFIIPSFHLVGGANITWNVYANDSTGREYTNGLMSYYVRSRSILEVSPEDPDGLNNWYVSEPEFTLIPDSLGLSTYYQWDADDIFLYDSPFGLEDIPNQPNITAGTLELNYWTSFACENVTLNETINETIQSEIFYIDLTAPALVDTMPANGSTEYNDLTPVISAQLEEFYQSNSGINTSSVAMEVDGILVNASVTPINDLDALVSYTPPSDLSEGMHNVTIRMQDIAGNMNEQHWFFTLNTTPVLILNMSSPLASTYGERRVLFDIELSGEVTSLEYIDYTDTRPRWKRLCRSCSSYNKTRPFKDGSHNVSVRALDSFGNMVVTTTTFVIDSKKPRISKTFPGRNKYTNGSNLYVRYTESNLVGVNVSFNPTQNISGCTSGRNQECFISLNLSAFEDQEIAYWFTVTDIVRSVDSKMTTVKVDTISPQIESFNYSVDGRKVTLIANITENNFDRVNYIDYGEGTKAKWRRLCTRLKDGICEKRRSFKSGFHNVSIEAIDEAGNKAFKNDVSFIIA